MARKYNWRRVRKHFSYDFAQAAKVLECSVATIRTWAKEGLPVMADQKPYLIDGQDLRDFAKQKSEALSWPKPDTNAPWTYFPCFGCKAYRRPYLLMVDYIPVTAVRGRLTGICETCDNAITKYCTTDQVPRISTTLDVTHQPGTSTLTDHETPK